MAYKKKTTAKPTTSKKKSPNRSASRDGTNNRCCAGVGPDGRWRVCYERSGHPVWSAGQFRTKSAASSAAARLNRR